VICELLSHCFAVGKDEVVVHVRDHDDDGSVMRTIWINAFVGRQLLEVLGQIVQVYLGRVLLGFLIVYVLDVYAPVGDASGKNSRYFHTLGYENIFLQKSDFLQTQKILFHTLKNNFIPSKK